MISDAILDESVQLLCSLPYARTDAQQFRDILRAIIRRDCGDAIDTDLRDATLDLLASERAFPAPATVVDALRRRYRQRLDRIQPSGLQVVNLVFARRRDGTLHEVRADQLDADGFVPNGRIDAYGFVHNDDPNRLGKSAQRNRVAPNFSGHAREFLGGISIPSPSGDGK